MAFCTSAEQPGSKVDRRWVSSVTESISDEIDDVITGMGFQREMDLKAETCLVEETSDAGRFDIQHEELKLAEILIHGQTVIGSGGLHREETGGGDGGNCENSGRRTQRNSRYKEWLGDVLKMNIFEVEQPRLHYAVLVEVFFGNFRFWTR